MPTLRNKAILVRLTLPSPTFSRIDRRVTAEALNENKAATDAGKFTKRLFPPEVTRPITSLLDKIRGYHHFNTLPWGDNHDRLLPSVRYFKYMEDMGKHGDELAAVATEFERSLDANIDRARTSHGSMFNEADFPTRGEIRSRMKIRIEPSPVPDGRDFRVSVNERELAEMEASIEERVADATRSARDEVFGRIAEPLTRITEALKNPKGRLYTSVWEELKAVVDLVPALNITEDSGLENLRCRIVRELGTYTIDELRENEGTRNIAAEKSERLLSQMAAYMG